MLQGTASFHGIKQIVDGTISIGHGPSPSVAELSIIPQLNFIGEGGTLAFHFDGGTVTFPDCKIDYNSLRRSSQGEMWRLKIFDRRWRWKDGAISGFYNLREEDGTIKVGTEKTPHELAALCFAAINEGGYSLAGLPNDAKPEVRWDYINPMEALAQLCDDFGCRIVLGLDNRVRICQVGIGAMLPLDGVVENSLTIDPPERPDSIVLVCGRDRYQHDFLLEAIGKDLDETIEPINDLSYKPAGGWDGLLPHWWDNVAAGKARRLALETVFRWYRVKVPFNLPFYGKIESLDQLAIESEQVATVIEDGIKRNRAALIKGVWFEWLLNKHTNTATLIDPDNPDDEYHRPFTVDMKNSIVKFAEPIYKNNSGIIPHSYGAATLRLRTACSVRDKGTLAWVRYVRGVNGGTSTFADFAGSRILQHDEIVLNVQPVFQGTAYKVLRAIDNLAAVKEESDYYLRAAEAEYNQAAPQSLVYMGLRNIELDGAIQQVVFNVGPIGATTMAARNTEILRRTIPYQRRREIEKQTAEMVKWQLVPPVYRGDGKPK